MLGHKSICIVYVQLFEKQVEKDLKERHQNISIAKFWKAVLILF